MKSPRQFRGTAKRCVLAIALVAVVAAMAAEPPSEASTAAAPEHRASADTSAARRRAWERWQRQVVRVLSRQRDADALLTAALQTHMLSWAEGSASGNASADPALSLVAGAQAAAPRAADIAWVALQMCARTPGCERAPYAQRLRALDPANAVARTYDIEDARRRGDAAALDRLLAETAAAKRYSDYLTRTTVRVYDALTRVAPSGDAGGAHYDVADTRAAWAQALVASVNFPPMQGVVRACKPEDAGSAWPTRRTSCHRIGELLEQGDSFLLNRLGLRLQAWAAVDERERAEVQDRLRRQAWIYRCSFNALTDSERPGDMAAYVELMRTHGSEQAAMQAQLVTRGIALEPPADWKQPTW